MEPVKYVPLSASLIQGSLADLWAIESNATGWWVEADWLIPFTSIQSLVCCMATLPFSVEEHIVLLQLLQDNKTGLTMPQILTALDKQ